MSQPIVSYDCLPEHRYGFDERPQNADWAHGINQMFGAIKRAFPGLRTAAALRWRAETVNNASVLQLGDSLDIWVQLYRHRLCDRLLLLSSCGSRRLLTGIVRNCCKL